MTRDTNTPTRKGDVKTVVDFSCMGVTDDGKVGPESYSDLGVGKQDVEVRLGGVPWLRSSLLVSVGYLNTCTLTFTSTFRHSNPDHTMYRRNTVLDGLYPNVHCWYI